MLPKSGLVLGEERHSRTRDHAIADFLEGSGLGFDEGNRSKSELCQHSLGVLPFFKRAIFCLSQPWAFAQPLSLASSTFGPGV